VSGFLNLLVCLVKYVLGKLSKKQKQKELAKDEGKKAVDDGEVSNVTGSFDRLRK